MKFSRETPSAVTVRHVEQGQIKVAEEVISENVVLFRDSIRRGFKPAEAGGISEQDIATLIAEGPEIIIFGSGWKATLPPRELVFALARKGIGFETMDTPAACRTFNILVGEDRDVAAVLLID
ncbi:MAG: Mth938-like domain-containing protein [Woeseiaceae bacterium]